MLILEGAYTMQFVSRLPLFSGSFVQKLFSNLFFLMFVDLYSVAGPLLLFALRWELFLFLKFRNVFLKKLSENFT